MNARPTPRWVVPIGDDDALVELDGELVRLRIGDLNVVIPTTPTCQLGQALQEAAAAAAQVRVRNESKRRSHVATTSPAAPTAHLEESPTE